jgi:hypothetical protein
VTRNEEGGGVSRERPSPLSSVRYRAVSVVEKRVIELDDKGWKRLFAEVLVVAIRMTRTRDNSQEATEVDRAREATQRAFERCLRVRPADVDSVDALRKYLVGSVRSALSNAKQQEMARRKNETAASIEQATVGDPAGPSAEVISLEAFAAKRRRERAADALKALRERLAGDAIALGTIECIEQGKTEPAQQARILDCPVEEIYAARKRRKRVLEQILAAQETEDNEEET